MTTAENCRARTIADQWQTRSKFQKPSFLLGRNATTDLIYSVSGRHVHISGMLEVRQCYSSQPFGHFEKKKLEPKKLNCEKKTHHTEGFCYTNKTFWRKQ